LASSAALSAWGQAGSLAPKAPAGGATHSDRPAAVTVQGIDGRSHQFAVPREEVVLQARAMMMNDEAAADLEYAGNSQRGCPVRIVNASFERPAQLVLTAHAPGEDAPTLRLGYRNFSGKDIESVVLTGWIKVKDSLYQLDSVSRPFALQLSRKERLKTNIQSTQALRLATNAIGVDRIELAQVNYSDGSTWEPARMNCVYRYRGNTEQADAR
jgi:hypothetical protein